MLQLRAAGTLAASPSVPDTLVPVDRLDPASAGETRRFTLTGRSINGRSMKMDRIDFVATKDATEVWEVVNQDGTPHNFHVHDVQFQVLSVGGQAPPPALGGWKDAIFLAPQRPVRLVLRFTGSPPGCPVLQEGRNSGRGASHALPGRGHDGPVRGGGTGPARRHPTPARHPRRARLSLSHPLVTMPA
ncbi:multicopper oxidase domain-containing protein [Micromonospora sp. NPDC047465]|uniref:multicopper oxidase domain-containing protein n=1 Tax=Micromonospora sp. NPDC047465 TaxID=3154813 RepID=UPI0033F84C13